ncbi:MAG TPA: signal peptidase II, partial [Mycobacteriales bacterium]
MSETDSPQTNIDHVGDHDTGGADGTSSPDSSSGPDDAGTPHRRRIGLLALTALVVLTADVVSKVLVVAMLSGRPPVKVLGGLVYLTETRNTGAAFSFAEGATLVFTLIAVAVVVVILRTAPRLRSVPWAICLGLILGGAAGNLVDRLARSPGPLRGAVVDWISVLDPHGSVWPIFNVADSAIVCGGVLAIVLATLGIELDGRRGRVGDDGDSPDVEATDGDATGGDATGGDSAGGDSAGGGSADSA